MERLFKAPPADIICDRVNYVKGINFLTNAITKTNPIYITDVRRHAAAKPRYALISMAGIIHVLGGVSVYKRIQFNSVEGEGSIRNAISRARVYYSELNVILREQDEFMVGSSVPNKIYVKHDAKVNLNLAAYQMILFARVHALSIRNVKKSEVFNLR